MSQKIIILGTIITIEINLKTMLITENEVFGSGLPISTDIDTAFVKKCISDAELFWLKPQIGDEMYIDLLENPEENATILRGGVLNGRYIAGIKEALLNYTFATILINNIHVTRYGSVEKNSEFSSFPSSTDIELQARRYAELAQAFIDDLEPDVELCKVRNDLFNKLLY